MVSSEHPVGNLVMPRRKTLLTHQFPFRHKLQPPVPQFNIWNVTKRKLCKLNFTTEDQSSWIVLNHIWRLQCGHLRKNDSRCSSIVPKPVIRQCWRLKTSFCTLIDSWSLINSLRLITVKKKKKNYFGRLSCQCELLLVWSISSTENILIWVQRLPA